MVSRKNQCQELVNLFPCSVLYKKDQSMAQQPKSPESQPYVTAKFQIQRANMSTSSHEADLLVEAQIGGHQADLEHMLGPEATQQWHYGGTLMDKLRKLSDYGINGNGCKKLISQQASPHSGACQLLHSCQDVYLQESDYKDLLKEWDQVSSSFVWTTPQEMASKKHGQGEPESEPYTRIIFNLERQHGTHTIHEADCGLATAIGGLKQDLESMFGVPDTRQEWYYKGTKLEDDNTLLQYGMSDEKDRNVEISVKIK